MSPDFAGAFQRGVITGVVGLLTQPLIILMLVVAVAILVWTRWRRRKGKSERHHPK